MTQASQDTGAAVPGGRLRTWHPGWMGVVLGTAGVGLAALLDPFPGTRLDEAVGAVLTALSVLGLLLLVPLALRIARHPAEAREDLAHPGLGALYGTAPASLLIVGVAVGQVAVLGWLPASVAWFVAGALVLGVAGALYVGVAFFARVVAHEQLPVPAMTGAWFIPIVVLVLVPSAFARMAVLQPDWRGTTSLALAAGGWGAGIVLFLVLAPVIAWRLITTPPPVAHQAASWWIWLAPAGAGGLGLVALGRLSAATLGQPVAGVAPALTLLAGTVLWGFTVWWTVFAGRVVRSLSAAAGGLPFHLGSWGFAFPTAAAAALTLELGHSWDSPLLQVVGAAWWLAAVAIWLRLAWQTVLAWRAGTVFAR